MLSINAVTYRNSATFSAPTWVAVPEIESVVVDPRYTEGMSNSRDSRFERVVPTLLAVNLTIRLKKKVTNANYEAFMDALALATVLDLLILDGPNTLVGARGVRGEMYVLAGRDDQAITNREYADLELKFADGDNLPKWAKVATGPTVQYAAPGGAFA